MICPYLICLLLSLLINISIAFSYIIIVYFVVAIVVFFYIIIVYFYIIKMQIYFIILYYMFILSVCAFMLSSCNFTLSSCTFSISSCSLLMHCIIRSWPFGVPQHPWYKHKTFYQVARWHCTFTAESYLKNTCSSATSRARNMRAHIACQWHIFLIGSALKAEWF